MGGFLWLKSRKKAVVTLLLIAVTPLVLLLMPTNGSSEWEPSRTYEQDRSAMGRIGAWQFAINLANDRPIMGGGFDVFTPEAFERWAPGYSSSGFAQHLVPGAGHARLRRVGDLPVLWWLTWRCASDIIRTCKTHVQLRWAGDLAAMIQVALVGFWVGGSFLGLAYFDLPYIMLALLVLTRRVVTAEAEKNAEQPMLSEPKASRLSEWPEHEKPYDALA